MKEESHDYRYFPDPDLPKLKISEIPEFSEANLRKEIPELPWEKRERLKKDFGLKDEAVEIYVQDTETGKFFELVAKDLADKGKRDAIAIASNYIISDLTGLIQEKNPLIGEIKIDPEMFAKLVGMAASGEISSRGAQGCFENYV